jgi:hypothetical protein
MCLAEKAFPLIHGGLSRSVQTSASRFWSAHCIAKLMFPKWLVIVQYRHGCLAQRSWLDRSYHGKELHLNLSSKQNAQQWSRCFEDEDIITSMPWNGTLTPLNSLDLELVDCCMGSLCEEFYFFSIFPFRLNYIFLEAFREYQAPQILTPYEPMVNFCWKQVFSSVFLHFMRSSYRQPCG